MVVDPQAVALRVAVGEKPPLEHLVGREADAFDDVHRVEGRLFDFGVEIPGIAVELQNSDVVQRKVSVVPYFRQIERVYGVFPGLLFAHELHLHQPARVVAPFDGFEQVALVRFAVFGDDGLRLGVGEVSDALKRPEMEFDPGAAVLPVVEAVRVASETVHVAERVGDAARRHGDGHLVQCLGQQRPEIPVVVRAAHARAGIALDGVVQVGEFQRVAQEEDGGVVAHQIPVARVGVEFDGESADVAFGIRRAPFSRHGREPYEAFGLLADPGEDRSPGVARDVVCHGEGSEGARTFGVHAAFGDHLAVEVSEFLQKPRILHRRGAAQPGRLNVLIVGDRPPVFGRQRLLSFFLHSSESLRRKRPFPRASSFENHAFPGRRVGKVPSSAHAGSVFRGSRRAACPHEGSGRLCLSNLKSYLSIFISRVRRPSVIFVTNNSVPTRRASCVLSFRRSAGRRRTDINLKRP